MKKDQTSLTEGQKYLNWVHNFGRTGATIIIAYMLIMPITICWVYDCFPPLAKVISGGVGVLALFIPLGIAEILSYTPILGSSCYVTFITGNVLNLKLPCAINSMKVADVESGTEEGDAIATVGVAVSSLVTIVVLAVGVVMLIPLKPLLDVPQVAIATKYMLPALFGGLFLGMLGKGTGSTYIKNKLLVPLVPATLVLVLALMGIIGQGIEGFAIIACLPITLLWARFLFKKGIIDAVPNISK